MPAPTINGYQQPPPQIPDDAYRVLLTGYGPFFRYKENPTWLAIHPLNNVIITVDPPDDRMDEDVPMPDPDQPNDFPPQLPRNIHITTVQLPLTYQAVHDYVPGFQARPPILPPPIDNYSYIAPPPESGYDLVFHIGLAGRGPLRMERLGHKIGYRMKDTAGERAPIVEYLPDAAAPEPLEQSQAAMIAEARLTMDEEKKHLDAAAPEPQRGFGKGYEGNPDDLFTTIDVERLVHDLKAGGLDNIYSSMDAGHHVCDFTYFCSLAEAKRTAAKHEKAKLTKVLFMHCPPPNQPFATEEVTEAIKTIIVWISQIPPMS